MGHPVILGVCIALIGLFIIHKILTWNTIVVDKYEYLPILSTTEWKRGSDIKAALERIKGKGEISERQFYWDMALLQEEGFVRFREVFEEIDGHPLKFRDYVKIRDKV
jgi:hypothetical protein